jgi:hypothetical protein
MLYSILSQINKGLRRIDILRKSEIGISPQRFEQYTSVRGVPVIRPDQSSTGNARFSRARKLAFFHSQWTRTQKREKTRTECEYGGLQSKIPGDGIAIPHKTDFFLEMNWTGTSRNPGHMWRIPRISTSRPAGPGDFGNFPPTIFKIPA